MKINKKINQKIKKINNNFKKDKIPSEIGYTTIKNSKLSL